MSEGIAAESATLDVPIQNLRDLPDGAGYTAKDGRACVELRKKGDGIEVIGRCDSISRLYLYYRDMCMDQCLEADSLKRELSWLKEQNSAQVSGQDSSHVKSAEVREKYPDTLHWWVLAGFAAGLLCVSPARELKNRITTLLKK